VLILPLALVSFRARTDIDPAKEITIRMAFKEFPTVGEANKLEKEKKK
jgi:hypothetical protein